VICAELELELADADGCELDRTSVWPYSSKDRLEEVLGPAALKLSLLGDGWDVLEDAAG